MTASWHVVAKLLTISRMSKVDYLNKGLDYEHESGNVLSWFLYV